MRCVYLAVCFLILAACGGGGEGATAPAPTPPTQPAPVVTDPPAPVAAAPGLYRDAPRYCVVLAPSVACFSSGEPATWRSALAFEAIRFGELDMAAGSVAGLFEAPRDGAPVSLDIRASGELFAQGACTITGALSARDTRGLHALTLADSCAPGATLNGFAGWLHIGGDVVLFIAAADATDAHRVAVRAVLLPDAGPIDPPDEPPTACTGAAPASDTMMQSCLVGFTGSWARSRAYHCEGGAWVAGEWTPTTPPQGACTPNEPEPPPVPPVVVTLAADPLTVAPGGASVLTWTAPADAVCHAASLDLVFTGNVAPAGTLATSALTVSRDYTLTCRRGLDAAVVASVHVAVGDDSPGCEATDSCDPPPLSVPWAGTWAEGSTYCEITAAGSFYCAVFRQGAHDVYQGTFTDETHAAGISCRTGAPLADWSATLAPDGPGLRIDFAGGLSLAGLRAAAEWADAPRCSP